MAGYPGTPLPKKLGIKAGHKVCLLNAPGSVQRHLQDDDVRFTHDLRLPPVDMVVLFVETLDELERRFADIAARLHPQGGFWVAWRTRRGGGISEDVVRRIALAAGMVDNKACTIDASWSGLRLVLRHEIRNAMMYRAAPPPPAVTRRLRRPTSPARIAHRTLSRASGAGSTLRRVRARSTK
ncbi:MAG: DUF3052 family protein [Deltaproteobacteria bacterium]|nr:DUF3052 family protein [Deltaproteobacteria bacterium]MDQ3295211.1 DUF3052 domain-containing protein [Myxococcota bacterium]